MKVNSSSGYTAVAVEGQRDATVGISGTTQQQSSWPSHRLANDGHTHTVPCRLALGSRTVQVGAAAIEWLGPPGVMCACGVRCLAEHGHSGASDGGQR